MAKKKKKVEAEESTELESKPVEAPKNAESEDDMDKWKVEDAANTLLRAEEIKQDSKLLAAAKKQLAVKGEAIGKITSLEELRKVATKKLAED
jgi:hypothetical protein